MSEIRSVRADDLWLSPAYGRDTVTFHFTRIDDEAAVAPAIAAVEERLVPYGARPHRAKLTAPAPHRVAELYPRGADFAVLRRRFDPEGKFSNAFVDRRFPYLTPVART
ncbi:hypothetical protein MTQ01_21680 [Streptomyces sp. XM4193]|uniref:D-arabinono-1,4-lactone oxidase n=1 Tax=Streptomyces sp. XM4193 TaxID=2929782 RepID=UPI001FF92EB3|nr:D-arabinono-1,4-lactone oxidase [Streptomyces sp. XM4193]MCK1798588.1 hypothetical protein [Streptomyces sp. XM4193]